MSREPGGGQTSLGVWMARERDGAGGAWVSYEAATEQWSPFCGWASLFHVYRTPPPQPMQVEQHAVRASGSGMKQTQAHSRVTSGKLSNLS